MTEELVIDSYRRPVEIKEFSPRIYQEIVKIVGETDVDEVPFHEFKEQALDVKGIIRSAEFSPYASVRIVAAKRFRILDFGFPDPALDAGTRSGVFDMRLATGRARGVVRPGGLAGPRAKTELQAVPTDVEFPPPRVHIPPARPPRPLVIGKYAICVARTSIPLVALSGTLWQLLGETPRAFPKRHPRGNLWEPTPMRHRTLAGSD